MVVDKTLALTLVGYHQYHYFHGNTLSVPTPHPILARNVLSYQEG